MNNELAELMTRPGLEQDLERAPESNDFNYVLTHGSPTYNIIWQRDINVPNLQ